MNLLISLCALVASVSADEWLPWRIIWDITPPTPQWPTNLSSEVTNFRILANATELPIGETMTVVAMVDQPTGKAVLTAVASGGQLVWSKDRAPVKGGQWIFMNVSSSISTFYGAPVDVGVLFGDDSKPTDVTTCEPSRRLSRHAVIVISTSVSAGVLGLCLCLIVFVVVRKMRRARVQRMPMPPSGEPGVYLPPRY